MKPPTLPASPWQASPLPDSHAIVTGDGYFLLDFEGLDSPPKTAAALRRAVAALPDLLEALTALLKSHELTSAPPRSYIQHYDARDKARAALRKAGYAATVPQTTETPAP
jgi:hypothetical protein